MVKQWLKFIVMNAFCISLMSNASVVKVTPANINNISQELPDIGLTLDSAANEVTGKFKPNSHVKLFLPNLSYLAISHAVNAALVRPANNAKGWQYDLATSHSSIDDKVWQFSIREDVTFQDGSPFNADSILTNMAYFQKKPFTFSHLHQILDKVEKVDDYTVRFYLSEPYGVFIHDALWLQFYTKRYLEKFGWNGKPTCPNLAEAGLYGLGPYILNKGYVEGDRSTKEVILKANPNYWGENKAKVETITIYTDLEMNQAKDFTLLSESSLDITPVPFADQVETVLSPFAKLAVSPSLNNYAMHFNLINGNKALALNDIRHAINNAIDNEYLLNLSMLGEGQLSPTMVSPNFYKVNQAINDLPANFLKEYGLAENHIDKLKQQVIDYQLSQGLNVEQPLKLTLLSQKSFMFLIPDIQHFLAQVHIDLQLKIVDAEREVFKELFATWKDQNEISWDLLLWGNYDWYKHPWSAFFVYRPLNDWSSIPYNEQLNSYTSNILSTNVESDQYVPLLSQFIRYIYQNNLMVFLPTPNNVFAINKEVVFNPGRSAFIYLRDIEVTDLHWSIRGDNNYPEERYQPRHINRQNFTEIDYE